MARLLQVEQDVVSVKRQLANTSQAWLLVFDNADGPDLSLQPYLPTGQRGDVIITSRNPGCQHYNTMGCQEVGNLSLDDSESLLTKVIYGGTSPSQSMAGAGEKIAEALGCLALAIVQAGAYIRETGCALQEYLDIYERRKRSVLEYLPKLLGTDYQYSVYTTWQVSIDAIESRKDAVSQHALRLLGLLGFYHHDQIPIQMFYNAWHQSRAGEVHDCLPWHDTLSDFLTYRQSVQMSTSLLASFSLIIRTVDASLTLHPLVHEWCRDRMSHDDQELSYRRALLLLSSSVKWKFETEDYSYRRTLVSHVHQLLRQGEHQVELSEESRMETWPDLALILGENGWTRDSVQLSEAVLKLRKNKLGEDHPNTLTSMANLANRYSEAGRRAEALKLTEAVLKLQKSKLGEDHPDTLGSMVNLANWYSEAGRRAEALKLTEVVLKLQKSKLGEDHPDTLGSMANLAIDYGEAGRREEALELSEVVLELQKSKLGEDHPDTLGSMANLAIRYSEAGRRAEALEMSEAVLELRKNKLGEDHPNTLTSMHNLANRYSEAGRRAEALEMSEAVLELRKNKLGEDHPNTLTSMHNLANRYSEAGRRMEALKLTEVVLKLQKSKLGEDHPYTLRSTGLHAYILKNAKEESPKPPARRHSRHRLSKYWRKIRT